MNECAGYPVASIFNTHDLPDYETYDSHSCPWCKQGKKIDALVNSFGYSSLYSLPLREKVAAGRMRADFARPRALQFYTFCPLTQGGFFVVFTG